MYNLIKILKAFLLFNKKDNFFKKSSDTFSLIIHV
jgi:hypothetical protein